MARIYPEGWRTLKATGAALREIETLEFLADTLPDTYGVYHGVHWTRVDRRTSFFGEIDFAIICPGGRLILIEQKSGFLHEGPDGLQKHYGETRKSVSVQMGRMVSAVQERLKRYLPGTRPDIDYLLYCPDYTVKTPGSAGIDPARIVDASRKTALPATILSFAAPETEESAKHAAQLHRFLTDELELVPDTGAMVDRAQQVYTHLSSGLSYWARQLHCTPHRVRIVGTAGSGKTQLALALLGDASRAGRRIAYVCYNRPLADHLSLIAPPGVTVTTYHQLADMIADSQGQRPDFTQPGAFEQLERFMREFEPGEDWLFDELIIDEGQDFNEDWRDSLVKLVRPEGRLWWLEDPLQNLYERPPVHLPRWVEMHADINYRSPQDIVAPIGRLFEHGLHIQSGSPITQSDLGIITYTDAKDLFDKTKVAITRAMGAQFTKPNIAIVTYRGRENSRLAPLTQLGNFSLRRYTGQYDLLGNPIYDEGDILIESVYRFKGQSAPCVIFTEIDFDKLDDLTLRKLYVGMTRAAMKLILVLSERSASILISRLKSRC